jgi:hypothetical protein
MGPRHDRSGDNLGDGVYYAVLTGEKKSRGSLLDQQKQC